jgi:ferredoxin
VIADHGDGAFTICGTGTIAGISLLVGGIGLMSVMLISITERLYEIGLRKADRGERQMEKILEALAVLRQAEEAGLVHTVGNTQREVYYICNCCTCSCAILRGVAEYGLLSAIAPSGFQARVDERLCTGCELCVERCQFGALSITDGVCKVDERRCFGCGVCVEACPYDVIKLVGPWELKSRPQVTGATE